MSDNQVIPAEAVEAAAHALFEKELGRPMEVSDEPLYSEDIQACREDARAALEAAAPHMLADVNADALRAAWDRGYATATDGMKDVPAAAWDEGRAMGIDECAGDIVGATNPYRPTP